MFISDSKVALIITAAGKSSRMGYPKGLYKFENLTLLEHHVKNFSAAYPTAPIILVLGHHIDEYQPLINKLSDENLQICINEQYEQGQFSSIKKGINAALKLGIKRIFLQPVDLAPISPMLYSEMIKISAGKLVVKPTFEGKSGHPVLLQNDILNIIINSSNGDRLDLILRGLNHQFIAWYDTNTKNVLTNINS